MKKFIKNLCLACLLMSIGSCGSHPKVSFASSTISAVPNYSQEQFWAALPWKDDPADMTPAGLSDEQNKAEVDVFFLHPTTYTGKKGDTNWNGPVRDEDLKQRTLDGPIQFQASIFNAAGRIYAPYYRQAHLHAYFTEDSLSARRAFDLAYSDVRNAFAYYLAQYNQGRPIIIASHSQGTTHAIRLIQDFFDGEALQDQLIAAYLVGIPVKETYFNNLNPCETATDTGCYCAWRTFKKGFEPEQNEETIVVTNPLIWTRSDTYAPKEENEGAVLAPFKRVREESTDAQVHESILWASKPRFPGSFLMSRSNYHVGDLNIFYMNVRKNAVERVAAFLEQ